MTHSWILDVLADLGTYARAHDLKALATQLDEAQRVAEAELRSASLTSGAATRQSKELKSVEDGGEARSSL